MPPMPPTPPPDEPLDDRLRSGEAGVAARYKAQLDYLQTQVGPRAHVSTG